MFGLRDLAELVGEREDVVRSKLRRLRIRRGKGKYRWHSRDEIEQLAERIREMTVERQRNTSSPPQRDTQQQPQPRRRRRLIPYAGADEREALARL